MAYGRALGRGGSSGQRDGLDMNGERNRFHSGSSHTKRG